MSLRDDGFYQDEDSIEIAFPLLKQRVSTLEAAKEKSDEILEKIADTQATLNVQAATLAISVTNLNQSLAKLQKESSLQTKILASLFAALAGILANSISNKLQGK